VQRDNGQFRGLMSVEATVYSLRSSSAILGIFDMNNVLPAA